MTNTKWLSALLAGTALTVASTAAMADSSFVTMTRNAAGEGVTFSVAPTADMPASATEVTVGGRVRAELYSENGDSDVRSIDEFNFSEGTGIHADWALYTSGKTDTSVGQVRAFVNMYGSDSSLTSVTAAGEWDFAPGLTFIGGRTTTLDGGTMGYGADIGTYLSQYGTIAASDQVNDVMGVRYSTGPISATVGLSNGESSSDGESYDVTLQAKMDLGLGSVGVSYIGGEEADGSESGAYSTSFGATFNAGEQLAFSGVYTMSDGRPDYYALGESSDRWDCDSIDDGCSALSLGATYTAGDLKFSAGYAMQVANDSGSDDDSEMRGSVAWSASPKLTVVGQVVSRTDDDDDEATIAGVGAWFRF